jgi:phenylalanyl-tRNA synthetase alpha chain
MVRVVLRYLERTRTVTDDEANALRERVYAAIHQGSRRRWAVRQSG